ncbi:hypothetical protein TSO221_06870 [Azospirillum sp. TSO22-1]|nr:hypothetical protein TSO221_06870 [Azospirillum sp. TSO22-1]
MPSLPEAPLRPWQDAADYLLDAAQRTVLLWDVLRRRGNQYREHTGKEAPHVLRFDGEVLIDGRTLARPVNYGLVRIAPPEGAPATDPRARPVVVVDPRAGHGPGIAGFKADSEIGMALNAGHPCYFVGFLPVPVPGQTIEDVAAAEALFLETVIACHPQAEGKPFVIGNCQAGWAVLMLAALRPELFGPILVAGSPLSYWAGVHGRNPMRYSGGLLGGSALTALTGDLGGGVFDGAWLVQNFENMNPANTLWSKPYGLYANVDDEETRYLEFERWWGGHVLLNAEEMQWIVDNLFVGNRLSSARIRTRAGEVVDLRNIRSPILCFCSEGDNITPPQQALGWILDLYADVRDIRAHGQTIVYSVHANAGHLGIFVSGAVARKEYAEFVQNIDFIDCLPPGLYEAVFRPRPEGADPALGAYIVSFEERTLDDIRALGGNSAEDDRAFAAAARLSEINLGLYRSFVQPWVRLMTLAPVAEALRALHPARLPYEALSDQTPGAGVLAGVAEAVRGERRPCSPDNPFLLAQERLSGMMETLLNAWRDGRDHAVETLFFALYGSEAVQAALGLRGSEGTATRRPGADPEHERFVHERIADLRRRVAEGGPREAVARAILYILGATASADERTFAMIQRLRAQDPEPQTLDAFKAMLREQLFQLLLDEERAVAAIAGMLPADRADREALFAMVTRVADADGTDVPARRQRLARLDALFRGATAAPARAALPKLSPVQES